MIPNKLSDWNLEAIRNIVSQGYFETISFDFKEKLPHSKNQEEKDRLIKTCCAFANQNGGFLIFGVKDNKGVNALERIVGMDSSIDFPEKFGNYPQQGTPLIEWDFLNPGITLGSGNKLHIVEIYQSKIGPIAYELEGGKWIFPIRTNKGNESMTYDAIKHSYVNIYEKRIKLNLLCSELESIIETATNIYVPEEKIWHHSSLYQFNIEIIENILFDTYTILASNESMLAVLKNLRSQCKLINNTSDIFWKTVGLRSQRDRISQHNRFVNERLPQIKDWATEGLEILKELKLKY